MCEVIRNHTIVLGVTMAIVDYINVALQNFNG